MGTNQQTESRFGTGLRRTAGGALAVLAGVLVVWSFFWVATRSATAGRESRRQDRDHRAALGRPRRG